MVFFFFLMTEILQGQYIFLRGPRSRVEDEKQAVPEKLRNMNHFEAKEQACLSNNRQ